MPFPIHDRDARQRLESRAKPYFAPVSPGLSIGYRRGKTGSRWVVRRRSGNRNVLENGAAVMKEGKPVLVPLSEDEEQKHRELLGR